MSRSAWLLRSRSIDGRWGEKREWRVMETWFAHPAFDFRKRGSLRSPGTHRRRVITGVAAFCCLLAVAVWVLAVLASPCELIWADDPLHCPGPVTDVIAQVEVLNYAGAYVVMMYLYGRTTWKAVRLMRSASSTGKATPLPTSHWTAAASRDVYLETSRALLGVRRIVAPFTAILLVVGFVADVTLWATGQGEATYGPDGIPCPPGLNLCEMVWFGDRMLNSWNVLLLLYSATCLVLLPETLWSPVTLEATQQTGDWRLGRMRSLPLQLLFPVCLTFLIIVTYGAVDQRAHPATRYWTCAANMVSWLYQTACMAWLHVGPRRPGSTVRPLLALSSLPASQDESAARPSSLLSRCGKMFKIKEGGVSLQRETLLIMVAIIFAPKEDLSSYKYLSTIAAVRWMMRVVLLSALLLSSDEDCTFLRLEEDGGAGFGLVVSLGDLFSAITYALKHRRPYPRKLRTYKASLLRMQETLSVSYRWQEEHRPVAEGVSVNMSLWQLESLLDALSQSTCRYVWMDTISVPQDGSQLQTTLLSRMMAVYASSGCTLVLRSLELDGSRYHQRGWTVQEFCSSSKTAIMTQPSGPTQQGVRISRFRLAVGRTVDGVRRSSDGIHYSESERRYFETLRKWHVARSRACKPFWLFSAPGEDVLAEALLKYLELSVRVDTQQPKDLVRALIPMLTNCPVETEDELLQLLGTMEARTDRNPLVQGELQRFQSHQRGQSTISLLRSFSSSSPSVPPANGISTTVPLR